MPSLNLSNLSVALGFKIIGDAAGDGAGFVARQVGDINGDGLVDIVVGAPYGDDNAAQSGEAYIIYGRTTRIQEDLDLGNLAPTDGFVVRGEFPDDLLGRRMVGAGDFNGDGIDDLIIAAPDADDGGNLAGEIFVVYGKLGATRSDLDISDLTPADGFQIIGEGAGDYAGTGLGAGDVNGDGLVDLIIGAPYGDRGGSNSGQAYVIFGKVAATRMDIDLSSLAAADGFIIQGDLAGDLAGYSAAFAGDVNGDGIGDIVVGAFSVDLAGAQAGGAYVIYGKPGDTRPNLDLTGFSSANGFAILGDAAGDRAGFSVAGMGDFNGDGLSDILVGAPLSDSTGTNSGAAYLIYGKVGTSRAVLDLGNLASADGFKIISDSPGAEFGLSVSFAGDIDGDGFDDIVIGAPFDAYVGYDSGAGMVVYGTADLLGDGTTHSLAIFPEAAEDKFGRWVDAAGDFDGDGIADLIIGATGNAQGGEYAGASYLIYGVAATVSDPFPLTLDLTTLSSADGFIIQGDEAGDLAGWSVSAAGDVNGDGIDDFTVGASNGDDGGDRAGEAYVIFGSRGGFGTDVAGRHVLDLTGLTSSHGFIIQGDADIDFLGGNVAAAGDINGDGIADIIVGAVGGDDGGAQAGEAYVIFGTRGTFGTATGGRQVIDVASLSPAQGFVIQGDDVSDAAGQGVGGGADFNGDGIADLLVGANGGEAGGNFAGEAYVIFGTRSGFGAASGGRQVLDLTSLSAGQGFIIQGGSDFDNLGSRLSSAGDINGDGIADIIVGAQLADDGGAEAGEAYIIFGSRSTFGTAVAGRQVIDTDSLTPMQGFIIQGDAAGDQAATDVAAAGDVNGDGIDDLIIGAPRNDNGGYGAGEAYVVFGTRDGIGMASGGRQILDLTTLSSVQGFVVRGDFSGDLLGHSVAAAGDIDGDGVDDIIVGAYGGSNGGSSSGEGYVIYGSRDGFGVDIGGRRVVDLTNLTENEGFIVQGDSANDRAGSDVSGAGDINGDGVADIIVGARQGGDGGVGAGEAYIIFGRNASSVTTQPPIANSDQATTDEGTPIGIDVLGNDTDIDGGTLSIVAIGSPANGTAVIEPGQVTYTPAANFNGTDSFTNTISDGQGGTSVGTVTVTVNPVNDAPPVASDDNTSLNEDGGSVTIDVLVNDSDVDGDALTAALLTGPANGSVIDNGNGTFNYTPDADFAGADSFTYTIDDGNGGSDTATVTITVNPVNDAPLAGDDTISAASDTIRTVEAAVLLANDSDIDGDVLTITSVQGAVNGAVVLDGSVVTFTPDAGFTGAASFTYTVSDGNGGSDTASVGVTVTEGNQPPIAPATQAATTLRGAAILVEVGASDPDGDVLTYGVSGAANGTAGIDEDGLVTYTPNAGFTGSETLVVTIADGNGGTASQEIALTVSVLPAANQFRLFAADGFAGAIGGSGAVIGTGGFQDIAVLDVAGTVSFDPSFNAGNDIVRLSGDADDWYVGKSGSSAIFTDGDTFVQLAVGPAGMAVVFDDGARTLRLDTGSGGTFLIGDQVFTATLARVDAAPDGTVLPGGAQTEASARLFLAEDGGASAAGKVNVIGTGGAEIATLLSGTITLDPSFNKGGDVIRVDEAAEDVLASKSGSSALLVGSDTTLLVPVGLAGATLAFSDGSDTRELLLSIEPNGITIDEQFFGVYPMRLMAAV